MKLRNKKTGKIGYFCFANLDAPVLIVMDRNGVQLAKYNSITAFNEEWEDYEKPKEYFNPVLIDNNIVALIVDKKTTRKEAEKAVEKLKAWKRLKDTYHLRLNLDFVKNTINFTYQIDGTLHSVVDEDPIVFEDMKTIFGGEE